MTDFVTKHPNGIFSKHLSAISAFAVVTINTSRISDIEMVFMLLPFAERSSAPAARSAPLDVAAGWGSFFS
jgi:hypothetical protein